MKMIMALIVLILTVQANASDAQFAGKGIYTSGEASLPAQIKLINFKGEESVYTTGALNPKFRMSDDGDFEMGQTTMCDPGIGRTAEEIQIPLNVTNRAKDSGKTDPTTYASILLPIGPIGHALLTIPKGTNTYGRCQNKTNELQALTFQITDPSNGNNAFDRAFKIQFLE